MERYDISYDVQTDNYVILDRKGRKENDASPVTVRITRRRLIKLIVGVHEALKGYYW